MWTYQMWQLMGEDTVSWAARAGGQNNLPSISRLSHLSHELSVDLLSSMRRPGSRWRRTHLWTLVPHVETPWRWQLWAGACTDGPAGGLSEGLGQFSFCPHVSWGPAAQTVLGDSAQKPTVGGTSAGCRCCWWGWWNSATKADERDAVCSPQLWHQSSTPPLPVTCAAAAGENDLEPLTRKVWLPESEHVHLHFCL